jgi:hypothetical protein
MNKDRSKKEGAGSMLSADHVDNDFKSRFHELNLKKSSRYLQANA